jgi:hypothetical protein
VAPSNNLAAPSRTLAASRLTLALVALGFASIAFWDSLALLVSPHQSEIYHVPYPATTVILPAIVNVLALAAIVFAALVFTRNLPRLHRILLAALLCSTPWIAVKVIMVFATHDIAHTQSIALFAACILSFLFFAFFPSTVALQPLAVFWQLMRAPLSIAGCVGAVTVLQLCWMFCATLHADTSFLPAPAPPSTLTPPPGRVLWIVLDELGQSPLYEHRLPGLNLPNLDTLRDQSTLFTHVVPAGDATEAVLPALITGQPVRRILTSPTGALTLVTPSGHHSLNPQDTVFHDADALGYRSAVVGWYNPYCRILPRVLTSCVWSGHMTLDVTFPESTAAANILHPLLRLLRKIPNFLHPRPGLRLDDYDSSLAHTQDFIELDHDSTAALNDPRLNFLLLHMPVPHPLGIWDRHTRRFAIGHSSYVDNLALADLYLGRIRAQLQAAHQWDDATIVLMGDHSWRTWILWAGGPAWSPQDQQILRSTRNDDRPAFLVKLPHQSQPAQLTQPFAAENTRALLDSLLTHSLTTPAQLNSWAQTQPPPRPKTSATSHLEGSPPVAVPPHKVCYTTQVATESLSACGDMV